MGCRGCGKKVKAAAKASLKTTPIHNPSQLPLTAPVFQQVQGNQDTSTQNSYAEYTSEELARVHTA